MNILQGKVRKITYVSDQIKQIILCVGDLIMDLNCPANTIYNFISFVHKEKEKSNKNSNDIIKINYSSSYKKEITWSVADIIMNQNCSSDTIIKLIKLIHGESKRLCRNDIIENLNLHCLI